MKNERSLTKMNVLFGKLQSNTVRIQIKFDKQRRSTKNSQIEKNSRSKIWSKFGHHLFSEE